MKKIQYIKNMLKRVFPSIAFTFWYQLKQFLISLYILHQSLSPL